MGCALSPYFSIVAYDRVGLGIEGTEGIRSGSLEEAASRGTVVLAVPISAMRNVLREISSMVRKGALVCDTCSVKMLPIEWMQSILPDYVKILGTHPCFGPDSIRPGFTGNKVVLCPGRGCEGDRVAGFLSRLGLTVIRSSPDEHDRMMARSQVLAHFLGRAVMKLGIRREEITTQGFEQLMEILQFVRNDTEELFRDLQTLNPYAGVMRKALIHSLEEIDAKLVEDGGRAVE